jgi:hypothetical protein
LTGQTAEAGARQAVQLDRSDSWSQSQAGRSVRQVRQLEPGSGMQVSLTVQAAEARARHAGQFDRSGS